MELGLAGGELAILAGWLLAGGAVAGLLSGLFGVGGGGILVPVLYELFGAIGVAEDVRMHMSVGTSFAIIVPTSFRAARSHYFRDSIDMPVLRNLVPAAIVGVVIGAITARFADDGVMKIIWVVSAVFLSMSLLFRPDHWQFRQDITEPKAALPIGSGIGFIATMMGVGGGAQIATILRMFGRPIHLAVGTAAGFSSMVGIPALIGYIWAGWDVTNLPPFSLGYISLIGAGIMIPVSVFAAPFGVRMAHGLPRRKLEIAFALFLLAVGIRFLIALG